MKRFRLRWSPRPKRAVRDTAGWRPAKSWLTGLLLFFAGLLLGLIFSFPNASLEKRILQEVENRGQVQIETVGLSFSPLIKLHGKLTVVRPENPAWPPVSIDSFNMSPLWLSLFSGNPGARWDGRLLNGRLLADLYRDGTLDVVADNLVLDLPLMDNSELRLFGRVRKGEIQSAVPLRKTTESSLELILEDVRLAGLSSGSRDVTLGTIVLEATGRGNSFQVTRMESSGGDFALDGNGTFLMGRNLASSRLNLRAVIRPRPNADPNLVSLLDLAAPQRPDGSHQLQLTGTLMNPTLR